MTNIWFDVLDIIKNPSKESAKKFIDSINSIYQYYNDLIKSSTFEESYIEFINIFSNKEEVPQSAQADLSTQLITLFYQIPDRKLKYYFEILIQILLNRIFACDFTIFSDIYNTLFRVKDGLIFNDIFSSFKICFDSTFRLYLEKSYINCSDQSIQREKDILNSKNSKYIVQMSQIQNKISDNFMQITYLPYFTFGTLNSFLHLNDKIEITMVDRMAILLEIATSLKDLHDNNQHFGTLNNCSVYIDSRMDAYLASFIFDKECNSYTIQPNMYYYQPPEVMNYLYKEEKLIQDYQKIDIFSFGVLMYEIITGINIRSKFTKICLNQMNNIIANNYFNFLVSSIDNHLFESERFFFEIKQIIGKCMRNDPRERYSSIGDVIKSIKELSFYKENIDVIELKIKFSKESSNLECGFSDLFYSYLQGNEESLLIIKSSLNIVYSLLGYDDTKKPKIEDNSDVFKSILKMYQQLS